jgi:serine/threonine-protein kinase
MIALSPDGSEFLYVSNATGGFYLRSMDAAEARLIPGTEQTGPLGAFSPDGEWIVFFAAADRQLKKVPKSGGAAVPLCTVAPPFGMSWSAGNTILYGQPDGIWRVSADGGNPERIVEAQQGEQVDSPQLLPGGDWVLFTSTRSAGPNRWDEGEIVVASLKSKQRKTVRRGGSDGRYVPTGHLVFAFGNVLYAVLFDLNKLEPTGGQVPIIQGVQRAANPAGNTSSANYAFSDNGSLVYIPGIITERARTLAVVDRTGAVQRLRVPPKAYLSPRLSPDEKKIVVETEERSGHAIWVYDLDGASDMRQLTLKGNNQRPVWMPDSRHITFASDQDGPMSIYTQSIDGNAPPERLTTAEKGTEHWPESWSPDGGTLSFAVVRGTDSAVWTVSAATRMPKLFADDVGIQRASAFSPDGKWIAYHSAESGGTQIYVQAYPVGAKKRVTQDGRSSPALPSRGGELFYTLGRGGGGLFARTFSLKDGLTFGPEQKLPVPQFINDIGNGYRLYDVSPDGKRFLMILPAAETTRRPQINIILNWFTELRQRVPVK